jgi:uncharacterized protein YndB with AHSA1/START domain
MTDRAAGASPASATARVQRVLPAPPERVFAEWVDPDAITAWMCPRPARCLHAEIQPWEGGRLRFDIEDAGIEFSVVGQFTVVDRPHRLSFTWQCTTWPDPTAESLVVVSLDPHPDQQTLMTIEHILLPEGLAGQHETGWIAIAAQLEAALTH